MDYREQELYTLVKEKLLDIKCGKCNENLITFNDEDGIGIKCPKCGHNFCWNRFPELDFDD